MDTSVQKGGVPSCLEHTSAISKIIEDAKRNHGVPGGRKILEDLVELTDWARFKVQPCKIQKPGTEEGACPGLVLL